MSSSVVIILKRPEGYEDVCAELVAEDFLKNNGAGLEYEATEATKDTSALLKEMAEALEEIVDDARGYESRHGKSVSWRERGEYVLQK